MAEYSVDINLADPAVTIKLSYREARRLYLHIDPDQVSDSSVRCDLISVEAALSGAIRDIEWHQ